MLKFRTAVAAAVFTVVLCLPVSRTWAKQAVITMKDGRHFEGELIGQNQKGVTLKISGINTRLERNEIKKVTVKPSIAEAYQQRRKHLSDDDLQGRYALAYWLFEHKAYKLAGNELADLSKKFPDSEDVRTLQAAVKSRIKMNKQKAVGRQVRNRGGGRGANNTSQARAPRERGNQGRRPGQGQPPLLDPQQINLIKVWELPQNLTDAQVNIRVPRKVMREVLDQYRQDPQIPRGKVAQRDFLRQSDAKQLGFLFSLASSHPGIREYYKQVHVTGDPQSLTEFRRTLYGAYVLRYFGQYFGTGKGPGVSLVTRQPGQTRQFYTNFYLLSTAKVDGLPMIDRANPKQSLLLQWGLPRESATHPAPKVEGWRPFFNGLDAPAFQRFADVLGSLYPDAGDYGIKRASSNEQGAGSNGQSSSSTSKSNTDATTSDRSTSDRTTQPGGSN